MKNLFAIFLLLTPTFSVMAQDDCDEALPACTTPAFPILGGSGPGDDADIPPAGSISNPSTNPDGVNSGCLLSGELNPVFITITVTSTGTLEFSMGDGVPTGCFDWAMWQVPSGGSFATGCAAIASNTLPPVTCNWNGACGGYTGVASVPPTHPATGVTGSPFDFQPSFTVNPGDQFILCFSNWSGLSTTVPIDFFGTAGVTCNEVIFICPGESATLTAPAGGSGYTWSPATGLSSTTGMTVTATPTSPMTYLVNYTDGTGAAAHMSFDVLFYTPPTPTFMITPEDCAGDNDAIITMTTTGAAPFTYMLDGVPQPSGTFTGIAPGAHFVHVTDANGCTNDTVVNVTAAPPCCTMTLSGTTNPTLCPGSCDGDATVNVTGATGTSSIQWLDGSGAPIGQTTPTATALCAGNYTAQVTDDICVLTQPVTVTELPGPVINSVNTVSPLCAGSSNGSITINHTGATQFSIDGGTTYQPSNIFNGIAAGTYNVRVLNGNNCPAFTTVTVTEPVVLDVAIDSLKNATCNGLDNGAIFITISGGTAPYNVMWSNGVTTSDNVGIPAGDYTVNVTDDQGCADVNNASVGEPTPIALSIVVDSASCYGYCDGRATATVTGGTSPYFYNWMGTSTSVSNIADNLCTNVYSLEVTDGNGCTISSLNFPVSEPAQVQVGTITTKDERCFASCDGIISINSPDGVTYSIDGGEIYFASNTFNGLCAGIYHVYVRDEDGCFNSTDIEIIRPAKVEVDFAFGPQPTDIFQTQITFNNLSPLATSFTWHIDSLEVLHDEDIVYTFPEYVSGQYEVCLFAQNDSACIDSACHTVIINDYTYIFLPNSFTPNADGRNDIFIPVVNNVLERDYTFSVYNRWGNLIFSTNDQTKGWDGTFHGIKSKNDVYVWKIVGRSAFNAEKKEWMGHVTLLE